MGKDYIVVDYDETVSVAQIAQMILDGWEVMPHVDDFDLNYTVYQNEVKDE